eukprot:2571032-Amphidinium_carterae.1
MGLKVIPTRYVLDSRKEKARLVVKDIRKGPVRVEHWSPTPSLAALKACLVIAAERKWGVSLSDISSAFLYALLPESERVAVTVPGDENPYILFKSLYGLRCAPSLWSAEFATSLVELGFVRSKVDAAVFIRKSTGEDDELGNMLVVVHVDDAAVFGERA